VSSMAIFKGPFVNERNETAVVLSLIIKGTIEKVMH